MNDLEDLFEEPLILIVMFMAFILSVFITRAIFSIPKILKYYKAQTLLLVKIARQQGVSENEISKIIDIIEPKPNPNSIINENIKIREIDKER